MKTQNIQTLLTLALAGAALIAAFTVSAEGIHPTLPGTNIRDYSQPGYIQRGDTMSQTLPGTHIRDYSAPGLRLDHGTAYPTLPGTNIRDYSQPGYQYDH